METGTPLYSRPGSTLVLQGLGLSVRPSGEDWGPALVPTDNPFSKARLQELPPSG